MQHETDELEQLMSLARGGDEHALAEIFERCRNRLTRMVVLRLDRRLVGRIDAADVLQEAYLDARSQLLGRDDRTTALPAFLWLRLVTGQRLHRFHRQHIAAAARNAGREVPLHRRAAPHASSVSLAEKLLGKFSSPSAAQKRAELQLQLHSAINAMDSMDREIIALRHFEELTNREAAAVLGLSATAASNRYIRALARLQTILEQIPGFLDEPTRVRPVDQ